MDTLSHALWALAIFWGTSYRWWAFLLGMLPDLLSFGLLMVQRILSGTFQPGAPRIDTIPDWVHTSYDITHSFITWLIVGVILYFVWRKYWPIVFAPIAHVALDIPTHCTYFPTPYLWPLPHPNFCGVSWSHPTIFTFNWLSLLFIFILIGIHEWQKRKIAKNNSDSKKETPKLANKQKTVSKSQKPRKKPARRVKKT